MVRLIGDFWVVVANVPTAAPPAFVMRAAEVAARAHHGEKEGRASYWLQPRAYDKPEYRERWETSGRGDDPVIPGEAGSLPPALG